MKTPNFINESELDFKDISTEKWREYTLANGKKLLIDAPLYLHVSDTGGHRIFDAYQTSHYIPTGWLALRWKTKKGEANFVL